MFTRRITTLAGVVVAILMLVSAVNAQQIKNAVPYVARPIPLSDVRLTGGPLKHAQDLDAAYLLKLEPDRMLAFYRKRAGLEPKAPGLMGWDGDGRNLTGHIAGHYLSAVSLMYAATGDPRFKQRADYIVKELREVQQKNGDGFAGALDGVREKFKEVAAGNIRSSFFDLNGLWSPWYTLHKTFAGLRDAYRYTGNRDALQVEIKFAAWAEGFLLKMDEAQTQKMLNTEFGGMNEVLVDLYADTGERRWLDLSHHFDHRAVLDPLARHEDILNGLHGNTQVPKLLGVLMRYIYAGAKTDGEAAEFFWDSVALHHSYATGGHGRDEYFGPRDQLSERVDGRTDESCNVYNLLKMTRRLFAIHPDVKYAEFEERALFNHVLGSIDPEDGRTCYMVPVGRGVQHEYQDMATDFTCCVGSGMESHGLHGDGIYYEAGDRLWVNLYVPSTANWKAAGVQLTMETDFPEGESASLKLSLARPEKLTLQFRRPSWAGDGFGIKVNGKPVILFSRPGSYIEITRTWKSGDAVSLTLPKVLHQEATPDNPRLVALMWGPLVLAGDLGPEHRGAWTDPVPSFVTAEQPLASWLQPVAGSPGNFRAAGRDPKGRDQEVTLVPFYRLHRRGYALYWDLYNPDTWTKKLAEFAAEETRRRRLEAATISFLRPGDAAKEKEFNQQGEQTSTDDESGYPSRRARKWFSFDLPVDANHPNLLLVTYHTEERARRTFEIVVDGQRVGQQTIERFPPGSVPGRFFDVEYQIPAELLTGKQKITVRFVATGGNETGAVYGIRIVRGDAER
ncbi:MAG TPA: beta-L-arabinofuranosidase domain-containing protein [Pyrinomonadaceae bacterium]|nr:beta-L-arabinofuranosidase domain-containing protein [Pyrinomonadaceae bacterium]